MNAYSSAHITIEALRQYGINTVVLSPGSRNAPLMVALEKNMHFQVYLQPDERAAAYTALGLAIASKKPVAVCCTSGTATANYLPAVVEAFYQNVPLVCLTADRPKLSVDNRTGQTIRQRDIFGDYIWRKALLETEDDLSSLADKLQKALSGLLSGPVHINLAMTEPLYETGSEPEYVFSTKKQAEQSAPPVPQQAIGMLRNAHKPLLLIGQLEPDVQMQEVVDQWIAAGGIAAGEMISNISHPELIRHLDMLIKDDRIHPDLLITIGRDWVSKRVKGRFSASVIHIENLHYLPQPFGEVGVHIKADPVTVLPELIPHIKRRDRRLAEQDHIYREKFEKEAVPWSDFSAVRAFMRFLPEKAVLHLGNSSAIRYAMLFDAKGRAVYSNRGTAGIDGSLSSAVGQAICHTVPTFCLLGDVSLFYDSNAMWLGTSVPQCKIVVINNGGGHIFQLIDGPEQQPQIAGWQQSPSRFSIEQLCRSFGYSYLSAESPDEIREAMQQMNNTNIPQLLEVITDGEKSAEVFRNLMS
jgi:2-succinyl-5-enolpyruvyl-6-hydroxy-3-cyclohexene-1-carboxylate synthase